MSKKLAGKVAIVTGASKGIGAAIARELAADGAAVVVNYASSKAGADKVVDEIKKNGGRAIAVQADLSKPVNFTSCLPPTKKEFDKLDILVNNAGIYEFAPLETVTPEHFHKQFDLNVLGLLLATQEAAKLFGKSGGSVINISSVAATLCAAQHGVYSGTKAAVVNAITRSLAQELARKIRVNSVNPAWWKPKASTPPESPKATSANRSKRNAARSHRPARRCRPDGGVPGVRRFAVDHRRNVLRLRRSALTPKRRTYFRSPRSRPTTTLRPPSPSVPVRPFRDGRAGAFVCPQPS